MPPLRADGGVSLGQQVGVGVPSRQGHTRTRLRGIGGRRRGADAKGDPEGHQSSGVSCRRWVTPALHGPRCPSVRRPNLPANQRRPAAPCPATCSGKALSAAARPGIGATLVTWLDPVGTRGRSRSPTGQAPRDAACWALAVYLARNAAGAARCARKRVRPLSETREIRAASLGAGPADAARAGARRLRWGTDAAHFLRDLGDSAWPRRRPLGALAPGEPPPLTWR